MYLYGWVRPFHIIMLLYIALFQLVSINFLSKDLQFFFLVWAFSIVGVSVRVSFFVFGGSDKDDIVRICCNGVFCFRVRV